MNKQKREQPIKEDKSTKETTKETFLRKKQTQDDAHYRRQLIRELKEDRDWN